jgi:hypothetical protein
VRRVIGTNPIHGKEKKKKKVVRKLLKKCQKFVKVVQKMSNSCQKVVNKKILKRVGEEGGGEEGDL